MQQFTQTTTTTGRPIKYTRNHTGKKLYCSDDDYIEIPGGSDTVPYTDDEGNEYEIPLDDLIEYDEDGEIEYTKGKSPKRKLHMKAKTAAKKVQGIRMIMMANMANGLRNRIYS